MGLEGKLKATVRVKVPYQDCDPAAVVWHGNYFRYFDLARCALLEKLDYGYRRMEEEGHVWPIIDTRVRFARPARFDDELEIEAVLVETEYRLKIAYTVRDSAGSKLTKGWTVQVAVETDTGELLMGSPPQLLERLQRYEQALHAEEA